MNWFFAAYMFIIGSILGSFLTLVGMRVPLGKRITGRSACDHCDMTIPWVGLIPVVGYFLVKGKCRYCHQKVSIRYPLLELLSGALFFFGYLYLHDNMIEYVVTMFFVSMMFTLTVSDIEHRLVPNSIMLAFLPFLLALRMTETFIPWYMSLLGALAGFLFMVLVAWYGKKRFKQEAMGGGDIKLYALVGLFLGIELVFLSLFFAAVTALLTGRTLLRNMNPIPFVPFIFAGSVLAYVFGPTLLEWYMGLF